MLKVLCVSYYGNIMMLVNCVRMQNFFAAWYQFWPHSFLLQTRTEIDIVDRYGSSCEINSQRAATPVQLLRRII
jgi:hypothetical protein